MYVERVRELADFIERNHFPFNYNQRDLCIGGHAVKYWGKRVASDHTLLGFSVDKLADFLDVPRTTVIALCFQSEIPHHEVTRRVAVKTLRHFAETGKVVFE